MLTLTLLSLLTYTITISTTICGNDFTQHIPLHIPRRSPNKPTASRNVAFKVAKMRDSIMEDQDELIIRKSECEELGLEANTKAVLEDVGHNA